MTLLKFLLSKKFLINLVLGIAFLFLCLFLVLKYLDAYTMNGETISVPDLKGMKLNEANDVLTEKSLKYIILDSVYVPKEKKGIIIEQEPEADELVKKNRTIYVTITKVVPPKVDMPNVVDMSQRLAIAKLESCGLKVGELNYMPSECLNCVLEQQFKGKEIKPGTKIKKGSVIDLVLGMGISNQKIMAPYVIGMNIDSAKKVLKSSYLNVGVEIYEGCKTAEDSSKAVVYKQKPIRSQNILINMGSPVDLWLTLDNTKVKVDSLQLDSLSSDSTINK
jgi:hypothetical protein